MLRVTVGLGRDSRKQECETDIEVLWRMALGEMVV